VKRLWQSARETANHPDGLDFVFYVDQDAQDTSIPQFPQDLSNPPRFVVGERIVLSEMWNVCQRNAKGEIFMLCGDDLVFRSAQWDKLVKDTFECYSDRIAFVHGDDGYWGNGLGTHGFLHKNWVDTVGYFVPPYFSADYSDTWLNEVANIIGRRVYLSNLITEHMHSCFGKAPFDSTYQEIAARRNTGGAADLYSSKLLERQSDAQKLQRFIENHAR